MAEVVRMPKLSDTMTEGVVSEWHKNVGDKVQSGDLLAEIETDKATMEFESYQEGVLLHIGVEKGKAAPVDSILAILGEKGENVQKILDEESKQNQASAKEEKKEAPVEEKKSEAKSEPAKVTQTAATSTVSTQSSPSTASVNGRLKVSPLARKLAKERGIDLQLVQGSGDGGRVVKRDIEQFGAGGLGTTFVGVERTREEPVSQMRKTIARRLAESKFTAPHFYLTVEIRMDEAMKARKSINQSVDPDKISFNDLVVKAAAVALKQHPQVNASWQEETIRYNEHVHLGVAVAVEDGLLVPVIKFADGKTLRQIGNETKVLAKKAREKKLQPEEWEGNTFTISNLGMFGIDEFTAIINPPDSCILAVGGIREVAVVENRQLVPGNVMKVTLSCDHRVVDGATGAKFLETFKNLMQNPVLLLGAAAI